MANPKNIIKVSNYYNDSYRYCGYKYWEDGQFCYLTNTSGKIYSMPLKKIDEIKIGLEEYYYIEGHKVIPINEVNLL